MIVPAKYAMLLRRLVLLPFTAVYGGVLRIRHALYDHGLLKRTRPEMPTIAIGNLALGGTGKTPMLELVIRTLEGISPLATLSRGYGREGTDIHEVHAVDNAQYSGDEPLQVKRKFPAARVFVGADRVKAITHIGQQVPGVRAVVLDDALQHRALDAGLNILLTTWQRPWCDDALVPAGRLRDLPLRAKAAEVVVVTKCPALPSSQEQQRWRAKLELAAEQPLFFSGIRYGPPSAIDGTEIHAGDGPMGALLVTGIADPAPLLAHVRTLAITVEHLAFPDHHAFTRADLQHLAERYANFAAGPKMLVTTEKDAARLSYSIAGSPLEGLPLAVIGMQAVILNEPERFSDLIRRHVEPHPTHR
jgi:tetraacyldisaccharide 4'-kinase